MALLKSQSFLFGGDIPWSPLDWTSSDDRVRNGSSYSEFVISPASPVAVFRGNLDIETLGGAGFASQRTTGENKTWDLSSYGGVLLDIAKSDGKKYTLTLKDELLPQSPDGREQSTISWEYDFKTEEKEKGEKVFAKWNEFNATYRGREKPDAEPLDLKSIKRISLMMRSFFGTQQGDFSLSVLSISAAKISNSSCDDPTEQPARSINENPELVINNSKQSWLGWLLGLVGVVA